MKNSILFLFLTSSISSTFAVNNTDPIIEEGKHAFLNLRNAFRNASPDFSNITSLRTYNCTGVTIQVNRYLVGTSGCGPIQLDKISDENFRFECLAMSSYSNPVTYELTKQGLQIKRQFIYRPEEEPIKPMYDWAFRTIRILPSGSLIIEHSQTYSSRNPKGGGEFGTYLSQAPIAKVGNRRARVEYYHLCERDRSQDYLSEEKL